jgi:broad specificity phosphatase PhoE
MTIFHLVRHGETHYDLAEQRRLIGAMRDLVPLTERGCQQAASAAERLADMPLQAVVTSPMTRAMQTAQVISARLDLPMAVEFDLHEWIPDLSFTYDSAEFVRRQHQDLYLHQGEWPSGGERIWEPLSEVRRRVQAALAKYRKEQQVVVVAHGMVIYALTGKQAEHCEAVSYRLSERN